MINRRLLLGLAASAEFNGERLTGRTWPASEDQVVVIELSQ